MKYFLFTGLIALSVAQAQSPDLSWSSIAGGTGEDRSAAFVPTSDGGYAVISYSNSADGDISTSFGLDDFWLTRWDASGNLLWEKNYGGPGDDVGLAITALPDGYALAGYSNEAGGQVSANNGLGDFWVVRTDLDGNLLWQNNYGGEKVDHPHSIVSDGYGGFLIAGNTESDSIDVSGNHGINTSDFWVIRIDSLGNLLWQTCYGGSGNDVAFPIIATPDGDFMVAGYTSSSDGQVTGAYGFGDFWVIRIDADGTLIWEQVFGGSGNDLARGLTTTTDGNFVVCGYTTTVDNGDVSGFHSGGTGGDIWAVKFDDSGNLLWQKCLGGTKNDIAFDVKEHPDGGFLFCGNTSSNNFDVSYNNGSSDAWVIYTDDAGNKLWDKPLGGSGTEEGRRSLVSTEGNVTVLAISGSNDGDIPFNLGGSDVWLVQLQTAEVIDSVTIIAEGPVSFCKGENVNLCVTETVFDSYQWRRNGNIIAGATASCYLANKSGNYSLDATIGATTLSSNIISVTVLPTPKPNITLLSDNDLCPDGTVMMKTALAAGSTYQWLLGFTPIVGATSNMYTATAVGTYRVQTTNSSGCTKNSAPVTVISSGCRLASVTVNTQLVPGSVAFSLLPPHTRIIIRDLQGRLIQEYGDQEGSLMVTLQDQSPAGTYLVQFISENESREELIVIYK
jgi:hypothetical protein